MKSAILFFLVFILWPHRARLVSHQPHRALADALNTEAPGGARSPFVTGYKTAYRVELARVIWKAIADAPVRRLEDLARARLV